LVKRRQDVAKSDKRVGTLNSGNYLFTTDTK